jgi:hypothetical protein
MTFVCPRCGALNQVGVFEQPSGCGCCGYGHPSTYEEEVYDELAVDFEKEKETDH